MFKKSLSMLILTMTVGIANADTYESGKYQDLSQLQNIDQESYSVPLNSIDRITMTAQALMLQNKIKISQRIKSISAIANGDDIEKPNTKIELIDELTGRCTELKASVYNGFLDENNQSTTTLNTIVKFMGEPKKC